MGDRGALQESRREDPQPGCPAGPGVVEWLPRLAPLVSGSPLAEGWAERAGGLSGGGGWVRGCTGECLRLRERGEVEAPWGGDTEGGSLFLGATVGAGETGAAVCERDCSRSTKYARKTTDVWSVNGGKQVGIRVHEPGFRWTVT